LHRSLTRRLALVAALLPCLSPLPAAAQGRGGGAPERSYVLRSIDSDDGLPDTQVNAIVQTPDGYLWLGTRRGLARYDGLAFHLFSPDDTPVLPAGQVNGLRVDRNGRLWIATSRGLVVRQNGELRRIPSDQVPNDAVWDVLHDRHGRLWVAGAFGLRVGDGTRFAQVAGTDSMYLYSLSEDAKGRIWMAGRGILASLVDGEGLPTIARRDPEDRFFVAQADGDSSLWVGTRWGALQLDVSDPRAVRTVTRLAQGDPENGNEVWTLTRTPDGDIWLGSERQGVQRWDGSRLVSYEHAVAGVPDPVWMLYVDLRGRVWAGTTTGLLRFQRSAFTTLADGLAPRSVWSVRADVAGTLWAATSDGRVSYLTDRRWTPVVPRVGRNLASAIWPRRDGGIYVAHEDGRILLATRQGWRDVTAELGLEGRDIVSLYEEPDGTIWAASKSALYRVRNGAVSAMHESFGLALQHSPRVIMRDHRGRLLVAGTRLTMVERGSVRTLGADQGLTTEDITSLLPEGDNLWIATADSGLFLLRNGVVRHLGRFDARLRREMLAMATDRYGYLWLSSSFGLHRVSRHDLERAAAGEPVTVKVRTFDRTDGLPTTEFNSDFQSQLVTDAQGRLWFPTYAGAVRLDPRELDADSLPPQVHLEALVVDGVANPVAPVVRLPSRPTRVELTFAATNALVPSRVRAEYRMVGIDSAWRDADQRRTLSFGPLRGGRYRLEVRVAAEDGDWNPQMATLDLDIPLGLHETAWFFPAVLVLAVGAVLLAARWRLRILQRREQQLASMVDERTRELAASRASLEQRVIERTAELAFELEERTRLEQRLVAAQKLEGIGRLAGGVAHEINNSITGVLGFTELARTSAGKDPALAADLDEIWKAGRRVADVARQLLAFARRQHSKPVPVQLASLLSSMERGLQQSVGDGIALSMELEQGLPPVLADPSQLEQLFVNLVMNARDAMPAGGPLMIRLAGQRLDEARPGGVMPLAPGRYVTVDVIDAGTGIAPEVRPRLFEPFFTTKDVNQGSGLGLAVCHGIVTGHGGAIEVDSTLGQGSRFTVWLPAAAEDASLSDDRGTLDGRERILLVEDEPSVREVATRMLSHLGYQVIAAADGDAALALVESGTAFDAIVSDVIMPRLGGPDLVRRLRARAMRHPVVLMSGYAGLDEATLADVASLGAFVTKPFTRDTLARALRGEIDRWRAA